MSSTIKSKNCSNTEQAQGHKWPQHWTAKTDLQTKNTNEAKKANQTQVSPGVFLLRSSAPRRDLTKAEPSTLEGIGGVAGVGGTTRGGAVIGFGLAPYG